MIEQVIQKGSVRKSRDNRIMNFESFGDPEGYLKNNGENTDGFKNKDNERTPE